MQADTETVYQWVDWLKSGSDEQQYQAAMALRALAGDVNNKHLIREAGGIEGLLRLVQLGPDSELTIVGAEALSCLAADDPANRVGISVASSLQRRLLLRIATPTVCISVNKYDSLRVSCRMSYESLEASKA